MANSTFNGPVRSEGGFEQITVTAKTGAVTNNFDVDTSGNVSGTGTVKITGAMNYVKDVESLTDATKTITSADSGTVYLINRAAGVAITGVSGTASTVAVGDETVTGDANMSVTNVVGTTALGTLSTVTENIFPVTGLAATGSVGSLTVVGTAVIQPTGVLTTGNTGKLLVWGDVIPGQTPNWSSVSDTQTPNWEEVA